MPLPARLSLTVANTLHLEALLNWLGDGTRPSDKKPPADIKRAIRALRKTLYPATEAKPPRSRNRFPSILPARSADAQTCFDHWASRFQQMCPIQFQEAFALAQELANGGRTVCIAQKDDHSVPGDFVWVIAPSWREDFWLETTPIEAEAHAFCKAIGWTVRDV